MTDNINTTRLKRYRLTYPFSGNKIYESKSFGKAVKGCYNEFKQLSDITEGMFMVTELGSKTTFQFQVNNKKIEHISNNKQKRSNLKKRKRNKEHTQDGGLSTDYVNIISALTSPAMTMEIPNIINSQQGGSDDLNSVQSIKNEIMVLEEQIKNKKKTVQIPIDTSIQAPIQAQLQEKINNIQTSSAASVADIYSPSTRYVTTPIENKKNTEIFQMIQDLNERIKALENTKNNEINLIKLDENVPKQNQLNTHLRLPIETDDEDSYANIQDLNPTTKIKIEPSDVYAANIKKLDAIDSMDKLKKTDKKCVIM